MYRKKITIYDFVGPSADAGPAKDATGMPAIFDVFRIKTNFTDETMTYL